MTIRRLAGEVRVSLSLVMSAKSWSTAEEVEEGSLRGTRRELSSFSWVTMLDRLWLLSVWEGDNLGHIPRR